MIILNRVPRGVKFVEKGSRTVTAGGWRRGVGTEFRFGKMKKFWRSWWRLHNTVNVLNISALYI